MKRIIFLILSVCTFKGYSQPQFSHPHGLYDEPISLVMEPTTDGATIRYTLDGSEPTVESTLYEQPLEISSTTVLRAVEVVDGAVAGDVATASYIYPESVLNQSNAPEGYPHEWGPFCQISGTAPAYYEMYRGFDDYDATVPFMEQGLRDLPLLSIVTDRNHLFSHERDEETGGIYIYTGTPVGDPIGRGWERPVSIELMGGPQGHDLTAQCGIVIHGGHGRLPEKNPKHSFRLKFKKEYGGKKTLHYPVFASDPGREHTEQEKYDQLVLRCHFGNSWQHWDHSHRLMAQYTRDLWARQTQKHMGWTAVEGLYVNLFINGLYWGLYNVAERIDDQFCKDHDGGEKSSYDVIKVEELGEVVNSIEASEGTLDAWNEMVSVAATADTDEGYLRLQGLQRENGQTTAVGEPLLDIDNFIDYMLINQYCGNNDWDTHNWYAFRQRGAESKGFQFLCWDSEQIFEGANDNRLDLNNAGYPTGIFQSLMRHPDFLHRYMDRAYNALTEGGALTEEKVVQTWDSLYHTIENALYLESSRWGDYRREVHQWQRRGVRFRVDPYYMDERNRLLTEYFPTRTAWLMNELTRRRWMSKTEAPVFLLNGDATIANDTLTTTDELTLSAPLYTLCTTDGERPVSWVGNADGSPAPTAFVYDGHNLLSRMAPSEGWVTVQAIGMRGGEWSPTVRRRFYIDDPTGIATVGSQTRSSRSGVYDLQGRRVADNMRDGRLPAGIYIVGGKKVIKE